MPLILSLNELSCRSNLSAAEVESRLDDLVGVLQAVRRLRPDASLITAERLPDVELAVGYPMRRWVADARNRDRWRRLRSMQDRAPFRYADIVPDGGADDHEYRYGADLALGLGIAHRTDGLAVSLASHRCWSEPEIALTRVWIDQDDDEIAVRHASLTEHVERHREWCTRDGADDVTSGGELWAARDALYPDLTFLPRVEQDLAVLQPVYLSAVRNRLLEIQDAVRDWNPADGAGPRWRSKITPEHEGRKLLCHFDDVDGERRLFDLHARFPPGRDMRLHFRLVEADRTARIAYIGRKLGI